MEYALKFSPKLAGVNLFQKNIQHLRNKRPELFTNFGSDPTLGQLQFICDQCEVSLKTLLLYNLEASTLPWNNIRFVFLDVDGVLTEGGMFYTEDGDEFKRFDTKDGMAIKEAMKTGLQFGIISSGVNTAIIRHRADMFGIKHVYVGADPKLIVAEKWLQQLELEWHQCGYIGDDINDLQMFEKVGIKACPADATDRIKASADFVMEANGGHGCVREFMRYFPALKEVL